MDQNRDIAETKTKLKKIRITFRRALSVVPGSINLSYRIHERAYYNGFSGIIFLENFFSDEADDAYHLVKEGGLGFPAEDDCGIGVSNFEISQGSHRFIGELLRTLIHLIILHQLCA